MDTIVEKISQTITYSFKFYSFLDYTDIKDSKTWGSWQVFFFIVFLCCWLYVYPLSFFNHGVGILLLTYTVSLAFI